MRIRCLVNPTPNHARFWRFPDAAEDGRFRPEAVVLSQDAARSQKLG